MALGPMAVLRVALAGVAPEVPAPPDQPRLEWLAPPHCPDEARGAEHLARFLDGRAPSASARVELTVGAKGGHVATVTVAGATRTLHAEDCETLSRAAALVVAVSLDPVAAAEVMLREQEEGDAGERDQSPGGVTAEAGGEPRDLDRAAAPRSGGTPLDAPREPAESTTEPASRRRPGLRSADMPRADPAFASSDSIHWLGIGGGIALALVPSLTGAVRLDYAFERGPLRLQAEVTYATPRTVTYPAERGVGGRFQSVAVGVRACFAPAAGRVAVPLCAGLEGGPIFGRGIGIADARRPVGAWIGGLAGAAALVRVHPRLAIVAGADLLVGLRRPAFHVGDRGTLFRAPPVGLRALAGLELRLR